MAKSRKGFDWRSSRDSLSTSSSEESTTEFEELGIYKIESIPRGYCLIFNNISFKDKNLERHGANFDDGKLRALFEALYFKVHVVRDTDKRQMEGLCTHFGGEDHSQYDAFVCIIMSHGTSGDKIMSVDGRTTGIDDLMSKFNAERCPSLANKPKIFLVQACRGSQQADSPGPNDQQVADKIYTDSTLPKAKFRKESDFLLAYSTVPEYVSYRTDSGSFFIQGLADVFERDHYTDHVLDMLVKVNNQVSAATNQVPAIHSTLRFKVYL